MTDQTTQYNDADLVYVDTENKVVVGPVEWDKNGNPKPLLIPSMEPESVVSESGPARRSARRGGGRRTYPWGTYKSLKKVYQIEGKRKKEEPTGTLDEVMVKALKEPYWD